MTSHHEFVLAFAPFVILAGCTASVPEDACDGARLAIDDCTSGALWAECGGSATEPVFACRRVDGRCYWFEGGCAAADFEPSPCPADDLCCIGSPFGYPFDDSWRHPDAPSTHVYDALKGWGVSPWDRARDRNVDVVIAPLAPAAASLECSGSALGAPCGDSGSDLRVFRTQHGVFTLQVVTTRGSLGGWSLSVEVIRDEDATLHARVCGIPFTDSVTFSCGPLGPNCATSGTLELAAFPEDDAAAATARVHLVATLADGTTLEAQL